MQIDIPFAKMPLEFHKRETSWNDVQTEFPNVYRLPPTIFRSTLRYLTTIQRAEGNLRRAFERDYGTYATLLIDQESAYWMVVKRDDVTILDAPAIIEKENKS